MPVTSARSFTIPRKQARNNKPSNQKQSKPPKPISETDPMYSIVPATGSKKSAISSLLLTPFSATNPAHEHPTTPITKKKKNFTSFRGLGCRTTSQVSVPAASFSTCSRKTRHSCIAASVDDFVVSRRPLSARGRVDVDKITPRERSSCSMRRMVSPENCPFLDTETLLVPRSQADWFGFRHPPHSHYGFNEGLAEIVMLQNSLMGGRTDGLDRYRSLRLNVDNMSYEELLELGDRIGYVSTGLKEDEITQCFRRTKPFFLNHLSHLRTELEKKCSICQEEYEAEDDMGKLRCGHLYHIHCIKQWLMHKNSCPVCKSAAMSDS